MGGARQLLMILSFDETPFPLQKSSVVVSWEPEIQGKLRVGFVST